MRRAQPVCPVIPSVCIAFIVSVLAAHAALLPGDVNGDNSVNAVDVQFVINAALGFDIAHDCDIDNDGKVNAIDVQRVINAALGLVTGTGPDAAFSKSPSSGGGIPLTVQFTDLSWSGSSDITKWQWDFGDGQTSTQQSPSHQYQTAGVFPVTLTVTTDVASDDSPAQTVVVSTKLLSVAPDVRPVAAVSGTVTFSVANTGTGTMAWTAAVAKAGWLRITAGASGSNSGTITIGYDANTSAWPRVGEIVITAPGAAHSPFVVRVTQDGTNADTDTDGDGLSDAMEEVTLSDPDNPDTDGDGLSDGEEFYGYDTSPTVADTDGDMTSDGEEVRNGTDPLVAENAPESYKDMAAAIRSMNLQLREDVASMSLSDALQSAAGFLEMQPNVASVHFKPATADRSPSLWAEFENDIVYVVLISPKTADGPVLKAWPAEQESSAPAAALPCPASEKLLSEGFPERPCAFANLFDAGTNSANTSVLAQMMKNKKYDVSLVAASAGGVEFFKTLANYGALYFDTHGAFFEDTTGPAPLRYAIIQTGDKQSVLHDGRYLANGDFAGRRITITTLIITRASDLPSVASGNNYAVTNEFIKTYVGQFERHSLVFMNCCQSGQLPAGAIPDYSQAPLFSAFLSKNAGTIFGWTESVGDLMAMKAGSYFFSRTLGDNDAIDPQTPPISPYGAPDAFAALQHKHYDMDTGPTAYLVGYVRGFSENLLLAPKINFLETDIENQELTLHGDFGTNGTPTVKAGEQQLTVKERDTQNIVVELSEQAKGPVTVTILDHESNPVPLTEWKGMFTMNGNVSSTTGPHVNATIEVRFREDIHSYRDQYPEDPAEPAPLEIAPFEYDCTYTYDFTSTFIDGDTKYEYTGSGSVDQTTDPEGNTWLGGNVLITMAENKVQFVVYAVAEIEMTITDLSTGNSQSYTVPYSLPLVFEHPIGQYGAISEGSVTVMGELQATWTSFQVSGAPDANTPAT